MGPAPQIYRFHWHGTEIEARYWARKWGVAAHLEIESICPERAPLPITDSGYRSHFHQSGVFEDRGGDVVAQVIAWLNEKANDSAWRLRHEKARQGELF